NGFSFKDYKADQLLLTLRRAIKVYSDKKIWYQMIQTAMKQDFSWKRSSQQYDKLYRRILSIYTNTD
ncbi:MAG: starch synthase, partial [Spirochaetota bacterium]|nr:starch synthase [Spirochaetota bacterium]